MNNPAKALGACVLLFALGVATLSGQTGQSSFDVNSLDKSTPACTDFYQHVNGGWIASNPIPAAFPSWGIANVLVERNREVLHDILEGAAKNAGAAKGSNEQKVGDFYASCMDEAKVEAEGLKPLTPEFERIAKIKDSKSLQEEIAHLHSLGLNALFVDGSTQDYKNSNEVIAGVFQGGLGL